MHARLSVGFNFVGSEFNDGYGRRFSDTEPTLGKVNFKTDSLRHIYYLHSRMTHDNFKFKTDLFTNIEGAKGQ